MIDVFCVQVAIMSHLTDNEKLLIIVSWFRKSVNSDISIDDICKIIVEFAKMYAQFDGYDKQGVKITGNGTIATAQDSPIRNYHIYCKRIIPNKTKQILSWKFRCWEMKNRKYWGIGFDAVENEPIYSGYFHDKPGRISYLYKPNGEIWKCGERIRDQLIRGWNEGDIVTLTYDGSDRELSISVNDEQDHNSLMKIAKSERGFRAVLVLSYQKDKAELLQ